MTYVPTCNVQDGGGIDRCLGAVDVCPDTDAIRAWRYVSSPVPGGGYGTPVRDAGPPVCLAADAVFDPIPAIVAAVTTGWQTFDLPGWAFTIQPATGRVLINVPTRFDADVPRTIALPARQVYGRAVVVTLTVKEHVWRFGDGNTTLVGAADPYTEYAHLKPGPVDVRLRTRYTATFTVQGSPTTYVADGVANVDGPPTELDVVEAHSELIAGDR